MTLRSLLAPLSPCLLLAPIGHTASATECEPQHEAETAAAPPAVTADAPVPGETLIIHYRGDFASRPNLTIHYGFDGWNPVDGVDDLVAEGDVGNKDYFKEQAMTKLADCGFVAAVHFPEAARAVHFVFYWDDDGEKHWDNNERRDYGRAVTRPFIGPHLTWNDEVQPEDGVVVNFQTSTRVATRVEYGLTPSLGTVRTSTTPRVDHHIALTGLAADTRYHYRVFGGDGKPSPIYSFETASADPSSFTFAVLGDMQDNGEDRRWKDVAEEITTNHADIDFALVVGDMPWNDQPGHWWTFFDKGRELLASKVIMPAVGNHDTPGDDSDPDTSSFECRFALPAGSGSEAHYAFRFGPGRFLSLNSEVPEEFQRGANRQYQWVQSQLASLDDDPQAEWLFAYWHIPPYSAAERHHREQGPFRDMTELFDGRVDWVFSGHEHLYQRARPLRYNARLASSGSYGPQADEGVGYLIVPPAGNHPETGLIPAGSSDSRRRERLAYPAIDSAQGEVESEIGFVKVRVSGREIELKTYGMGDLAQQRDAHVVDSVSYTK